MKFLVLLLSLVTLSACTATPKTEGLEISGKKGRKVASFEVEVAKDQKTRTKGLMGRSSLPADEGMLFLFDVEQEGAFWMKNTLIPLDMIFIKADGTILSVHSMAQPHSLKVIKSGGLVKAGLEINGGLAKKLGIKPGQTVTNKSLRNHLAVR